MADQGQGQTTPTPGAAGGGGGRPGAPRPDTSGDPRTPRGGASSGDALSGAAGWAGGHPPADALPDDEDDDEPFADDAAEGLGAGALDHELRVRIRARRQMREFLRAVPRREEHVTLTVLRPDGSMRTFTRRELTAAIDRLRPRQRQIVRLSIEERWTRQSVCDYLRHISMKTFERDQVEALDLLLQL